MNRILLVEDDLSLIDGLEFSLNKNGFQVDTVRTIKAAFGQLSKVEYDLLLLDLTLPDGTGFDICKHVREYSMMPIIFLTASDEEVNIVMGLDMGGDDYITKPFRLNELMSRIKALLRRAGMANRSTSELKSNGIIIKLDENRVIKNNNVLELTGAEYRLLCLLMQNPNQILTRMLILDRLWDENGSFVDDNTLSVYVRRLRSKVEDDPQKPSSILTVRGVGYRWNEKDPK
ncbi:response regulator transcription factor [Acetobacterium woodii]|uniref:Stage 0 sporulation protein A homolog n=1 Tax=Acetobacterium woodii (strain ATCC 29683 / DSM 1030 / JCM 2381 / KCTC 1655 / WB1) TaxID=931626 RepID=H6LI73_ACEWD|nr:response regulator transcription factor [Acetobacterium woodii]AFA49773.1 transcriptional regulator [Acetobacterium woodii DSM 1030]